MLSAYFFKKNLIDPSLAPANILQRIAHLWGCTYLENNGQPVIGFLPSEYCLTQDGVFQAFQRSQDGVYKHNVGLSNLTDFIQIGTHTATCREHGETHPASFKGGYIGFYDYNLAANLHTPTQLKSQPQLYFGLYLSYLTYENGHWYFCSTETQAPELFQLLQQALHNPVIPCFKLLSPIQARWNKQQYRQAFQQVQDYIVAGDCYQINLTQEFIAAADGLLLDTATELWQLTNAPYSAYLKLDDFEILSCSPELFIEFQPNRKILTKPIKGTTPRHADPELDQQSRQRLIHSEKDQAENLMIVDLLRNDLSIYANTGSVKTLKLFNIESFNQVHHMVSEISAELKPNVAVLNVLHAALPGGSITGAPKIRAMQIIEELEQQPRGAYCGSMGYFNLDGTGSWNILIRTVQKYQQQLSLWAGGGITIASDCDAEYQECFDKVSAMLNTLKHWYQPHVND